MPRTPALDGLDRAHLLHGFVSPAMTAAEGSIRLVKGRGPWVWDDQGRKYLDGLASLWNVAAGHGRREIAKAAADQMRQLAFAPTLLGFASEPAVRLAARIAKLTPKGLSHVVFTSGGSESNESVIRMVRLYSRLRGKPDKVRIVALTGAYHGSSTGAASLTGLPGFHRFYEPMMPEVDRIARPHCYRCELGKTFPGCALACADELERTIERVGADRIGAIIAEPIQGVGGVIIPPAGYFERLRAICDRHDILLVVDEVITGFGRTGKPFGIQHWNAVPDMLVFAKAVTSGYVPLGGVVYHERIHEVLVAAGPEFVLHNGYTYSGHPVACAAALANLDLLERGGLFANVRKLAPGFKKRLTTLRRHPIVGDVRTIGLIGAVELVSDRATRAPFPADLKVAARIRAAALARGVILRAGPDAIAVCPPFVVGPKELDLLVDTLDAAITTVAAELSH